VDSVIVEILMISSTSVSLNLSGLYTGPGWHWYIR